MARERSELAQASARARSGVVMVSFAAVAAYLYSAWFLLPGQSFTGVPHAGPELSQLAGRLSSHVGVIAGEWRERHSSNPETLDAPAAYIEGQFRDIGLAPRRVPVITEHASPASGAVHVAVDLGDSSSPSQGGSPALVIVAHYDSVPGSPGGDDNASGVAILIEVARQLHEKPPASRVALVAAVSEVVRARHPEDGPRGFSVEATGFPAGTPVVYLDSLGIYHNEPGTQRYPFPLSWFTADRGNFVAFLGAAGSQALLRSSISAFRTTAEIPSKGLILPAHFMFAGDTEAQASWDVGTPAIVVTDTWGFRHRPYHTALDTPELLDTRAMARVTLGVENIARVLSE